MQPILPFKDDLILIYVWSISNDFLSYLADNLPEELTQITAIPVQRTKQTQTNYKLFHE